MMQAAYDKAVAAEFALQPFGDAGDGGGAQARFLLYLRVGDIGGEQFGCLEAFGELRNLFFCEKVAQKSLRLVH